jgi:hypothetical protein
VKVPEIREVPTDPRCSMIVSDPSMNRSASPFRQVHVLVSLPSARSQCLMALERIIHHVNHDQDE